VIFHKKAPSKPPPQGEASNKTSPPNPFRQLAERGFWESVILNIYLFIVLPNFFVL
jgi:hypothetical protein